MAEAKYQKGHSVSMRDREMLDVTGVVDVISFDEEIIITETDMGIMIVRGENLHVINLNVDTGNLAIAGYVVSINYEEDTYGKNNKNGGLLAKLFK